MDEASRFAGFIRKSEWEVRPVPIETARHFIERHHYAGGASNTFTFLHGLFRVGGHRVKGVVWWIPPTKVACQSVNDDWRRVIGLSRMAVAPDVPKGAVSFLMSRSIKAIRKDGRFLSLVTYADESQGHTGAVYEVCGWTRVGKTGPYPRWINPRTGQQVSRKATTSRTDRQMRELGFVRDGDFFKHKFVLHLPIISGRVSP